MPPFSTRQGRNRVPLAELAGCGSRRACDELRLEGQKSQEQPAVTTIDMSVRSALIRDDQTSGGWRK